MVVRRLDEKLVLVESNDLSYELKKLFVENCTIVLESGRGLYAVEHVGGFLLTLDGSSAWFPLESTVVVVERLGDLKVLKIEDKNGVVVWERKKRRAGLEERKKGAMITILNHLVERGTILAWTLRPVGDEENEVVIDTERGSYVIGEYELERLLELVKDEEGWIESVLDLYAVRL